MLEFLEIAQHPEKLPQLKILLEAYGHYMYDTLGLVAGKDQFFNDLANLPGKGYERPMGSFILVCVDGRAVGCAGIKKWDHHQCELKRMFVFPDARGKGTGRQLCLFAIEKARELGYQKILLDTNLEMKEAVQLYCRCGFQRIKPYCINENKHPIFMEYDLSNC